MGLHIEDGPGEIEGPFSTMSFPAEHNFITVAGICS